MGPRGAWGISRPAALSPLAARGVPGGASTLSMVVPAPEVADADCYWGTALLCTACTLEAVCPMPVKGMQACMVKRDASDVYGPQPLQSV